MAFGDNGEKVNGKLFALDVRGALVVKLPKARVDALVVAGKGTRFEPSPGRVMKEWLVVDAAPATRAALKREARAFVDGDAARTKKKKGT
jgi:hypothetical protein